MSNAEKLIKAFYCAGTVVAQDRWPECWIQKALLSLLKFVLGSVIIIHKQVNFKFERVLMEHVR